MNEKLTPFDAINELDCISVSVEQISNTLNIVRNALEDYCPSFNPRKDISAEEAIRFTKCFPQFFSALDFLDTSLIDLVHRIDETVNNLFARLREEKEEEKKPRNLEAEIFAAFAQLIVEDKKQAIALAQKLCSIGKEDKAA